MFEPTSIVVYTYTVPHAMVSRLCLFVHVLAFCNVVSFPTKNYHSLFAILNYVEASYCTLSSIFFAIP